MIETNLDPALLASLSLREKQIQQNYRPVIAVHKWFARRPGALFRGLILSEFVDQPLAETYYGSHSLASRRVLDPFMGGGTPLLEANRLGCDVLGIDINPMAYWIVKEEIEEIALPAYLKAAEELTADLKRQVGELYTTSCDNCGAKEVPVKYFLWVKKQLCRLCDTPISLFPGPLLARAGRHPKSVLVCVTCGTLNEVSDDRNPGHCSSCSHDLTEGPFARRNSVQCASCGSTNRYPQDSKSPPRHTMFAIEYHCPHCGSTHKGRFFKKPDSEDLARFALAEQRVSEIPNSFVPDDPIPPGDETNRLLRWGYSHYAEMFNARQLLALHHSAQLVARTVDQRIRRALATNLSDLLRYQNMLCRYDTGSLKSLDIFSVHGFPVGLVQCESNILGIKAPHKKAGVIGSGGWLNIVTKYATAKDYCDRPFETKLTAHGEERVYIKGESIGTGPSPTSGAPRSVKLVAADAASFQYPDQAFDAVFTDPPYLGNVQYAELMDFCYVWLRRLVVDSEPAFTPRSTRSPEELTRNISMGRDLNTYAEGLSAVFGRVARALKPGAPLAFTFHHNYVHAYCAIALAILDARLVCSLSVPIPAEMGGSIHISGTGSSIVDTVFVCRAKGKTQARLLAESPAGVATLIRGDLHPLEQAGFSPTNGDIKCIAAGHLTRLAIWSLRAHWDEALPTQGKITTISEWITEFGGVEAVISALERPAPLTRGSRRRTMMDHQPHPYEHSPLVTF